jgi:hypothetical protein
MSDKKKWNKIIRHLVAEPALVHIVGRSGVDSYLVLVVSGYGTLGPELVRGGGWGRGGGGGVFIYLVSSSVCVDVFCCLEF